MERARLNRSLMANNYVFMEVQGFQRYLAPIGLSRMLALDIGIEKNH
jgi:thiazole synthase ThiGH ThiG subunit